jgi:hypothetical protein
MSLLITKATIETPNDDNIQLLIIGANKLQVTSMFAEYLDKLTFDPIAIHAHLLDDEATVKSAKAHIQSAYIDDIEVLIGTNKTHTLTQDEVAKNSLAQEFLNSIEKGHISNEYFEELHKLLGEDKPISPWKNRKTEEAPKTGEIFYAVDSKHGSILYTMHWSKDNFMTENECWSGNFRYWMPAIGYPEDYLC